VVALAYSAQCRRQAVFLLVLLDHVVVDVLVAASTESCSPKRIDGSYERPGAVQGCAAGLSPGHAVQLRDPGPVDDLLAGTVRFCGARDHHFAETAVNDCG
jgi:hypothetical protein